MKQLLFLFLFPCLALAQYTGNGNQKITLGEQSTADGLVFRGVASIDTVTATSNITRANKQDTSAFILIDTVTNLLWHYKTGSNGWIQAGGSVFDTTSIKYVNTYGTQTVNEAKTFTSTVTGARFDPTSSSATGTGMYLPASNKLGFSTNGTNKMTLDSTGQLLIGTSTSSNFILDIFKAATNTTAYARIKNNRNRHAAFLIETNLGSYYFGVGIGADVNQFQIYDGNVGETRLLINSIGNVGIGTTSPSEKLHVVGNARISAMSGINDIGADANGVLQAATSDMNLKNTIEDSPFGLNEILLLNPVTFLYNDENRKIDSDVNEVGFIAQDVFDIIPNAVSSTGTGDLQLDYRAITATLVKAIQEQNALIKALEQRIINLENK